MRKTPMLISGAVAALLIGGVSVATASARNGADDPTDKVTDVRGRDDAPETGDDKGRGRDRAVDDSPDTPEVETEHGPEGLEVEVEHGQVVLKPHGGDDSTPTIPAPAPAPAPAPVPTTASTIDDHGGDRAPGVSDDGPGDDHGGNRGPSDNSGPGNGGQDDDADDNSGSGGGGQDDDVDVDDDHGGHGGDDVNDDH